MVILLSVRVNGVQRLEVAREEAGVAGKGWIKKGLSRG